MTLPTDREETYHTALALVREIDQHLTNGTGHYWTKQGQILTTLDEVIRAILEDNLLTQEEGDGPLQDNNENVNAEAAPQPSACAPPLRGSPSPDWRP